MVSATPRETSEEMNGSPLTRTVGNFEQFLEHRPHLRDSLPRYSISIARFLQAEFVLAFLRPAEDSDDFPFACSTALDEQAASRVAGIPDEARLPASVIRQLRNGRYAQSASAFGLDPFAEQLDIRCYLGIPLRDDRSLFGVLLICNYKSELGLDAIQTKFRPLLATFGRLNEATDALPPPPLKPASEPAPAITDGLPVEALEAMPDAILLVDGDGRIRHCNQNAGGLLGRERDTIIGAYINDCLPHGPTWPESRISAQQYWDKVPVSRPDGHRVNVDMRLLRTGDSKLTGIVIRHSEPQDANRQDDDDAGDATSLIAANAPVALLHVDRQLRCLYANDRWHSLTHNPADEDGFGWIQTVSPRDRSRLMKSLRQLMRDGQPYRTEFRICHPAGEDTWVEAHIQAAPGTTDGALLAVHDIDAFRKQNNQLKKAVETDYLTGLCNRSGFYSRLDQAMQQSQRDAEPIAVLYLDIDGFKQINDLHGHGTGDRLLVTVGQRLESCVRSCDTVSRIGGDEFTVLLRRVKNPRALHRIAHTMLAKLADPVNLDGPTVKTTASIGIALSSPDSMSRPALLAQADAALYKAKQAGKNQYRFFAKGIEHDARLHERMRLALASDSSDDFDIVYQPFVDASTNSVIGVEALTRWKYADKYGLSTRAVIQLIEDTGLIDDFFEWQIARITRHCMRWQRHRPLSGDFRINVNLSGKLLHDEHMLGMISAHLRTSTGVPDLIAFEIPESAFQDSRDAAKGVLQGLSDMRFHLSLDNYGAGSVALEYIRDLPIETLKLDRRLVAGVLDNRVDAAFITSAVQFADSLGIRVIAEGVETKRIRSWLLDHGCRLQQGFLYAAPLPASVLENELHRAHARDNRG